MRAKPPSFIIVGLALFSMFFGSGNLIFPLFLGQIAGEHWLPAFAGFSATAVALPLLAVFAMIIYKGKYENFFNHFGKTPGWALPLLLLTVWIPLGSAPRCTALAYASLLPYFDISFPLWLFALVYCSAVFWMVWSKNNILDILGYFLTPLLLLCLAVIISQGISPSALSFNWQTPQSYIFRGLNEGYNTMDLIAAFFFSASIIDLLKKRSDNESLSLTTTLKGSFVAAILLLSVYLGLLCLSTCHLDTLQAVPKEQLFVQAAKSVLGPGLGIIAAIAVFSACLTTSIALSSVFADFLAHKLFQDPSKYHFSLILTQLVTFAMAITGLEGITFVTEPLLQILYPLLLLLILFNLARHLLFKQPLPITSE